MVLGQLLLASASLVHALFQVAWWLLIARIVLSWVNPSPPPGPIRSILRAVYDLTDPVLDRMRRLLPFLVVSGLDLTPIVLFFVLRFADTFLTGSLASLGASLA